ncbi:urate oxidase [Cavenderia fasciculata]|uniref:Uricase n=1 Tax=Cavenderia fasciculata TaxID=261658 RepID=F4Q170_CACFS|nr:urate oxidase [Cavenderia fasciculata]EGG18571.1 urate oxidase [Cavenderia fasciculata]|eukprot:XP_004366475.1 urate oxidase [Cavenderia fasciculata]
MATLIDNRYGKARVRVLKVNKNGDHHSVFDFDCCVLLKGDFSDTYYTGANDKVVATDSTKNTVYLLAQSEQFKSVEEFGVIVGKHFLATYSHVSEVQVTIKENVWDRMRVTYEQREHDHSFVRSRDVHTASIISVRGRPAQVTSGIEDLLIMKTTGSGFEGFYRDKYTTLKETKDRVFATMVTASWTYNTATNVNYVNAVAEFKKSVFDIFALTYSKSVQETLYIIAKTALERVKEIDEIKLSLPNKHAFGFDFTRFEGVKNNNTVFQPVEEPSGLIEGTIKRAASKL